MKNRGHTNIVIMNDLDTTSWKKNYIKVFNRKLLKKMKMYEYAKILVTNLSREHFTQHGQHMIRLRKELTSMKPKNHSLQDNSHPPSPRN